MTCTLRAAKTAYNWTTYDVIQKVYNPGTGAFTESSLYTVTNAQAADALHDAANHLTQMLDNGICVMPTYAPPCLLRERQNAYNWAEESIVQLMSDGHENTLYTAVDAHNDEALRAVEAELPGLQALGLCQSTQNDRDHRHDQDHRNDRDHRHGVRVR